MSFNILLFLQEIYVVEKPLEVYQWGPSNEYPQHMFSWRNKENIYLDIPLFWSYAECVMCRQIEANTANLLQAHNFVQLQLTGYFEIQGTLWSTRYWYLDISDL